MDYIDFECCTLSAHYQNTDENTTRLVCFIAVHGSVIRAVATVAASQIRNTNTNTINNSNTNSTRTILEHL